MNYELLIPIILALLGAVLASFVNAFALRRAAGESNIKGRSKCPKCGKTLAPYELIPIFSWFILRGKCRSCKRPISPRYMLTEVIAATVAVLIYIRFGLTPMTPFAFAFMVILLAIALIDLSTMEIPNGLIIALIPFAIAAIWLASEITLVSRAIGFAAISLPMLILALIIGGAFGGGDIKLMAVCGFLLGWQSVVVAMFIALLTGGTMAITLLATKKANKKEKIPFGPHLCIGIVTAQLYGEEIVRWYLGFFNS